MVDLAIFTFLYLAVSTEPSEAVTVNVKVYSEGGNTNIRC